MRQYLHGPIGIFDSGLGGLTVAKEIHQALPYETLIYLGDTARCPYGPKDQSEVSQYVYQIASYLSTRKVKLIVIACNTATAAGLRLAQKSFQVPVIGVVNPGAEAAIKTSKRRRIGVIGTQGTIDSRAYEKAILSLDAGAHVMSRATPEFVRMVEEGMSTLYNPETHMLEVSESDRRIIKSYLTEFLTEDIDTLVLGCTHFPLLEQEIQKVLPGVSIISSAKETALQVRETLTRRNNLANTCGCGFVEHSFITTSPDTVAFSKAGSYIFDDRIESAQYVSVDELEQFSMNKDDISE